MLNHRDIRAIEPPFLLLLHQPVSGRLDIVKLRGCLRMRQALQTIETSSNQALMMSMMKIKKPRQ